MKIISHRGNINGPELSKENSPSFIENALLLGYDVEIDVWVVNGNIFLGHDIPTYSVELDFLKNKNLWCHAKNLSALELMLQENIHCFWHQNDDHTITSNGYIWTYPGKSTGPNSVLCCIDNPSDCPSNCYGVCTDYPNSIK